ncbi:MAG: energy transducer TonB [Muribaculaceae bacterium]|nr:energy transducer TonB [Muribaculaceae bacterium]
MANLTSKEWRDLIFEGKNKEFGAYDLRKKSEKRHTLAVIFTLIGLAIVIVGVIAYTKISDHLDALRAEELLLERERMQQIEMAQEEEVPEEEEPEEQKFEQELPEVPEEVLATVQVTQIAIVDADKVKNEVMTMDEQKEDNTARGVVTQEGSDDADKFQAVKEQVVVVEEKPKEEPKPDKIFEAVEQPAEFPGGQSALTKWLSNNIRYPEQAQQNGVSGRVIVRFVVEKDGSIGNVTVLKGVDKDLDNEAIRVVKRMPKWQAGKNNGQAVRSYFTLPVTFKLQNQ